ncbi:ABC transporter permease [Protaetiibacter mangrovi]|uniref:ABC transporter permease n=1 Tax=Protaetiibacter mangrovi TaxID=2970926 RepID=A0ABT1ZIY4_9MICO|nr:ABC transporter permease [Protaetiibacter mangrovi]MCS0500658.1 ABC transporter permease [Protaetiibacter mangrovi]TPX05037.1 ABC transporter permease [Schumannella luteola]
MTAVSAPRSAPSRVWRIVRLITANPTTTVVLPWAILGTIFLLNWLIWLLIFANVGAEGMTDAQEGIQWSGAAFYIFVYMLVLAVQAINLSFPLALGYGSTRREFSLGAGLTFVLLAAMYAVGMTVGAALENATGGWGLGGTFFRTIYFGGDQPWYLQLWIYFCWFLFFFFTGTIFASVYVRWKALGLIATFAVVGLAAVGVIALLTLSESWNMVWETIAHLGVVGSVSVLLIPSAVSALLGYLLLRRATTRG